MLPVTLRDSVQVVRTGGVDGSVAAISRLGVGAGRLSVLIVG